MGFFVVVVLNIPRESKRRSECTTRSAKFLDSSFKPDSFWTSGMACNDPAANLDGWKGNVNRVQSSHESQTNYFPTSSVPWYCLYSKLLISYFHVSFFFSFSSLCRCQKLSCGFHDVAQRGHSGTSVVPGNAPFPIASSFRGLLQS